MGRKSAAKAQNRQPSAESGQTQGPARPGAPPPRRPVGLIAGGLVVVLAVLILFAFTRSSQQSAAAEPSPAATASGTLVQQIAADLEAANLKPHPQPNLPPLPFMSMPPARPIEVVRDAYRFAAEHPEVLSYVPCYCGCEHSGHRGNEDCFVVRRDGNGDVTEWEPHGMT